MRFTVLSCQGSKLLFNDSTFLPCSLDTAVALRRVFATFAVPSSVDPVAVIAVAVALHQRPVPVRHTADHLPQVRGSLAREDRGLSEVADAEHRVGKPDTNAGDRIGAVVALFK